MSLPQNLGRLSAALTSDASLNIGVGVTPSGSFKLEVGTTSKFTGVATFGSTLSNGTYSYTLPGATGTLALVGGAGVGTVTSVAAITLGTSGTDLSSTVANGTTTPVITLQVPTASAANRGALSSADWTTFNSKESALTFSSPLVRTVNTISIPVATTSVNGYLSSTDWTTFNNKQSTITLTTTGTSGAATFSANTLNIPNYGSALSSYLPLSGGTLTGALIGTTASFTGAAATPITAINTGQREWGLFRTSLDGGYMTFQSSGATARGYIGNGGGISSLGETSFGIRSESDLILMSGGNNVRLTISSTGAATFSSSIQTYRLKLVDSTSSTNFTLYTGVDNVNSIGFYNETTGVYNFKIGSTGAATFSSLTTGAVYSTSGTLTNTAPSITATGGTIVTSGGFKYHTFTSSGTFQVTAGSGLVEVFVLGGGGAGGGEPSGASFYAGGGGAGGGLYNPAYYVEVASYTVTVGAGGTPNAVTSGFGGDGSNSVFGNITALGGGGGARGNVDSSSSYLGRDGGCGGGGGSSNSVAGITTQSITNGVAYGNGGANGNGAAGGGGGIGTQPTPNTFGGYGKYVMNQANRIGGGGGGGTYADGGVNAYDGGGRGGRNGSPSGTAGTANTGGGGGGLGYASGNGASGGSGIVIVKYKA